MYLELKRIHFIVNIVKIAPLENRKIFIIAMNAIIVFLKINLFIATNADNALK